MRDSKAYQQLLIARKKIIFFLLSITIIAYFAFISVIAFYPSFFGQLIGNSFFSMGIVLGFILILLIFAVTLIYVYQANKKLEPLIKKIQLQLK